MCLLNTQPSQLIGAGEGGERAEGELGWKGGMECRKLLESSQRPTNILQRGEIYTGSRPADQPAISNNG